MIPQQKTADIIFWHRKYLTGKNKRLRFWVGCVNSFHSTLVWSCRDGSDWGVEGGHPGCHRKVCILKVTASAWEVTFQGSIQVSARKCDFQDTCINTGHLANLYLTMKWQTGALLCWDLCQAHFSILKNLMPSKGFNYPFYTQLSSIMEWDALMPLRRAASMFQKE